MPPASRRKGSIIYRIQGLDLAPFADLFSATDADLSTALAACLVATSDSGFPSRMLLEEARAGESLLLVHRVSNDVHGPFRMAHAIYVRERAERSQPLPGTIPENLDRRTIGLCAFDAEGMLVGGTIAAPGAADGALRSLLLDERIA